LPEPDKWAMNDLGADFIYTGQQSLDFMLPNGLRQIQDASIWSPSEYVYPLFSYADYQIATQKHATVNFVSLDAAELVAGADEFDSTCVIVLYSSNAHQMPAIRRAFFHLIDKEIVNPVIIHLNYTSISDDQFQLFAPMNKAPPSVGAINFNYSPLRMVEPCSLMV
jgi:(E)-4-hydroxy-3-methylbut-2-enyl-diphosphate synthase